MVAGGYLQPEPQDMGLANVNSSIGSSWRTRVNSMDAAAQLLVDAGRGTDTLNVNLAPAGS